VRFHECGSFGDEVVFLRPELNGLRELHFTILDALASASIDEQWEYDGAAFEPHMTLGARFVGDDASALRELLSSAAHLVVDPFEVAEVVEFHRSAPGAPYLPRERLDLSDA
jgi:2'-5' RNA ligase